MAKYSYEFKMNVVQEYINGNGGFTYLSQKYSIPAKSNIKNGLMRTENLVQKE